ncbi:sulfurtransferase [Bryobacter aggregatus]|uniref:sulfurtransferase n=1 Tax=Bryobacter aggregatus TaxID=360054 RepID=UPI0004E1503B|nr:sulfurtransferase [Bryobacter aggregatus]
MPSSYAYPEVLVSPAWLSRRLDDPSLRIVEVDLDPKAYWQGHIPGALSWSWSTQLSDPLTRDILSKNQFELLLSDAGIDPSTTVVLYGDHNNWFAAWAFWQLKIFGHQDVRLLNGGRSKWIREGRALSLEEPVYPSTIYFAADPDPSLRALLPEVRERQVAGSADFVDVRSVQEFSGEILAPPGSIESCQRGGHIPGAKNIPWSATTRKDGMFKSFLELRKLFADAGVDGSRPVITYCRIGERSSHTWFVLRYLLGYLAVKNYDGSWTEWGNLVGAPVERGPGF